MLLAMASMDICYSLSDDSSSPPVVSYVFPSLLPVLDPVEAHQVFGRDKRSANQVVFGRRYVLQDSRGFPPTLLLYLFRRLHALADRVELVRRDHFFMMLFGVEVMVRFNTSLVGIRSSSGYVALSLDLAVCASSMSSMEVASCALDRVALELALTLASDAQFHAVRLVKYGFTSHRPSSDDCQPEADAVLGDLVWADPLAGEVSAAAAEVTIVPEQHFAGGHGVVVNAARQQFLGAVGHLRAEWLGVLPDDAVRSKCETVSTVEFVALFERGFLGLLCDPFWAKEGLPTTLPPCLLSPPSRFGHLPTDAAAQLESVEPRNSSSGLFEGHSVSVLDEVVASGRFGKCYYRGLDRGGIQKPIVVRAIRLVGCEELGQLVLDVSALRLSRVVLPVLSCKRAPAQDLFLLPLDGHAFELTLAEALADTSIDERTWLSLLADVATGLHELHSHNIVHGRLTIESSVVVSRDPGNSFCPFIAKVE